MKLRLMICAAAASTALFAGENDATSATYAVMNVTNAYTDTVIAVPWVGLDGSTITISNLVNTTTLSEGDKLYMYDGANDTWYEYTKSGAIWTVAETVSGSGSHTAESQVVQRGSGLVLQRTSAGGTVFLCGRVDSSTVSTTIAANGKTLFANPTASAVNLNDKFTAAAGATEGDTIMIPLSNGGSDTYTFKENAWGKMVLTEVETNGRKRKQNTWTPGGSIPAGTGAWYQTTGDGYTVTW